MKPTGSEKLIFSICVSEGRISVYESSAHMGKSRVHIVAKEKKNGCVVCNETLVVSRCIWIVFQRRKRKLKDSKDRKKSKAVF